MRIRRGAEIPSNRLSSRESVPLAEPFRFANLVEPQFAVTEKNDYRPSDGSVTFIRAMRLPSQLARAAAPK
jgi:hypothetical protein